MRPAAICAQALEGIGEVHAGDEPAGLIAQALARDGAPTLAGDSVLVVAHKLISKAEGRVQALGEVAPGPRARELAAQLGKDPRLVEVVLRESVEVRRAERGVLIVRTRHGFVCANAGVDASNASGPDAVVQIGRAHV